MANLPLPPALVLRNGATEAPPELVANLIEQLIHVLDLADGDADLEDGDPDTGVEDDPLGFDPEQDCCPAGDDRIGGEHSDGAGDADDAEPDGGLARRPYRDATRARACIPRYHRTWDGGRTIGGYEFVREPVVPRKRQLLRLRFDLPGRAK